MSQISKNADFIIHWRRSKSFFQGTTKKRSQIFNGHGIWLWQTKVLALATRCFSHLIMMTMMTTLTQTAMTYYMQVSVLVRPKDGGEKATNISLMQAGNVYSPSYIWPFFKERLAKQIVSFFYNVSQRQRNLSKARLLKTQL